MEEFHTSGAELPIEVRNKSIVSLKSKDLCRQGTACPLLSEVVPRHFCLQGGRS
jgi:hypothetical protein